MPSSFQEGIKLFLRKSKNSDANSSESSSRSSRSIGESSSSGPSPKRKEHSSVSGLVSAFGGCFVQSNKHEDLGLISGLSVYILLFLVIDILECKMPGNSLR